ncbi:MAG: ABC transporter ATP-binding protein, partial [Lachnospiraceae bacterium]|nr:ABC transporter ATP-binding protein [Lachnospiraceae bacterium]
MLKIIKFARHYWYIMILIFGLLIVQAYCDLSLPQYTSNIVDTGIQAKGIESPVPEQMRVQTYDRLMLFMTDEQQAVFAQAYALTQEGTYRIKEEYRQALSDEADVGDDTERAEYIETLRNLVATKETLVYMLSSQGEEAEMMKNEMLAQMGIPEGTDLFTAFSMMDRKIVLGITDAIEQQLAGISETVGDSTAIAFVTSEYEQMGIDVNKIQMGYLRSQGVRMLMIAMLGVFMAVISAFLSSRLAARVSMNLRDEVFRKVVRFSNAEINQFSTASLITRCTNDIQQVQIVLTMMFRIVLYAPIMAVGGITKVIQTRSGMGWIIVLAVACISVIVALLMVVAMPKFRMMQTLIDRLNLVSREILTGIPVIRAFGREKHEEERFDKASTELKQTQLFTSRTMALMMPAMMFIMNGITVLIVWTGAHGVDNGTIQVGSMLAFITYTMQIVMSFLMITAISIMLPRASVAAQRVEEVLAIDIVIDNKAQTLPLAKDGSVTGKVAF